MPPSPPAVHVPAGWYPDPQMPATQRYWDGKQWTHNVSPMPPPTQPATDAAPAVAQSLDSTTLVTSGWVMAVLFPIIGFIIGIVLLTKRAAEGAWIMAGSLMMVFMWSAIIDSF